MKKNQKITLLLLALLVVMGIGWFIWQNQRDSGRLSRGDTSFAYADTAGITEIRLIRSFAKLPKPEELTLKRTPDGWVVNERFEASPRQVQELLGTLAHIQVRELVAPTAQRNAFKIIGEANVEVRIKGAAGTRTYFVGPAPPDKKGSLAYLAGSRTPVVVELPGFYGSIAPQLSTKLADWRDLLLLSLDVERLARFAVTYPGADSSFALIRQPNGIWKLDKDTPTDTVRSQMYMQRLRPLYAVSRADDLKPGQFEALKKQTPHAKITATDTLGNTQQLTLHPNADDLSTQWAWRTDRQELMLMQNFVLDPLLITRKQLRANSPHPMYGDLAKN